MVCLTHQNYTNLIKIVREKKVYLEPNESRDVMITIAPIATNHPMGVWDNYEHDFVVKPGEYTVYVVTSSEDTPYKDTVVAK